MRFFRIVAASLIICMLHIPCAQSLFVNKAAYALSKAEMDELVHTAAEDFKKIQESQHQSFLQRNKGKIAVAAAAVGVLAALAFLSSGTDETTGQKKSLGVKDAAIALGAGGACALGTTLAIDIAVPFYKHLQEKNLKLTDVAREKILKCIKTNKFLKTTGSKMCSKEFKDALNRIAIKATDVNQNLFEKE